MRLAEISDPNLLQSGNPLQIVQPAGLGWADGQLWAKIEIFHDLLPLSHLLLFIFEREAAVERLRPQNLESGVAQLAERGRRHQGFDGSNLAVNAVLARAAAARDDEHRLPAPQEALRVECVQVARPADAEDALVAGAENRRQTVVPHRTD